MAKGGPEPESQEFGFYAPHVPLGVESAQVPPKEPLQDSPQVTKKPGLVDLVNNGQLIRMRSTPQGWIVYESRCVIIGGVLSRQELEEEVKK